MRRLASHCGTLNGPLLAQSTNTIGLQKTGPGTLIIAGTAYNVYTATNFGGVAGTNAYPHDVQQGTLVVSALMANSNYSELGNGNVQVQRGATFQLANVQLGTKSDQTGTTGNWIDLYDGSSLLGSGTSCLMNTDVTPVIGSTGVTSMTIGTVNASDVFSILNSVKQLGTIDASGSNAATIHINGPGTVQLQPGGLYTNNGSVRDFATGLTTAVSAQTFGGNWSVDQGTLELGPYYTSGDPRSRALWRPLRADAQRAGIWRHGLAVRS